MSKISSISGGYTIKLLEIDGKNIKPTVFRQIEVKSFIDIAFNGELPFINFDPKYDDALEGVRIVGRHNYQVNDSENQPHFIFWYNSELFLWCLGQFIDQFRKKTFEFKSNEITPLLKLIDIFENEEMSADWLMALSNSNFFGYNGRIDEKHSCKSGFSWRPITLESDFIKPSLNPKLAQLIEQICKKESELEVVWLNDMDSISTEEFEVSKKASIEALLKENELNTSALFRMLNAWKTTHLELLREEVSNLKENLVSAQDWKERVAKVIRSSPKVIIGA